MRRNTKKEELKMELMLKGHPEQATEVSVRAQASLIWLQQVEWFNSLFSEFLTFKSICLDIRPFGLRMSWVSLTIRLLSKITQLALVTPDWTHKIKFLNGQKSKRPDLICRQKPLFAPRQKSPDVLKIYSGSYVLTEAFLCGWQGLSCCPLG